MKRYEKDPLDPPSVHIAHGTRRWEYVQSDETFVPVPALAMFGYENTRHAIPLPGHHHDEAYEFVYIASGRVIWDVAGHSYETVGGDVFHTRPFEVHRAVNSSIEPSSFWWFQLRQPPLTHEEQLDGLVLPWLGLSSTETAELMVRVERLPRVVSVSNDPSQKLLDIRNALADEEPLSALRIRTGLVSLLLDFTAGHRPEQQKRGDGDDPIERIAAMLISACDQRFTLDGLADLAGLSPSHLSRTFHAQKGISVMDFAERARVQEACRRLRTTHQSITNIAHELGYATSQHFSTVFRKYMGRTPSRWREDARHKEQ